MAATHEHLTADNRPALVVSDDLRVPRMVAQEVFPQAVPVLKTLNLLELAEEKRIVPSAAAIWQTVLRHVPTAGLTRQRPGRSWER